MTIICDDKQTFYKKTPQTDKAPLTSWCWRAGGSTSSGPLAGCVSDSPLHGARSLGCAVGVGGASCPFQRLIQQERFLVDIVALTAAAVGVTGVIGLWVVLWKEGRDTAGTFREEEDKGWRKKIKQMCLMACVLISPPFLLSFTSDLSRQECGLVKSHHYKAKQH